MYIIWVIRPHSAVLTLPARTSSCTYICTYKGTQPVHLKGRRPTRPARTVQGTPKGIAAGTPTRTFKCTFIGHRPSVVPQVQLVMSPRGSRDRWREGDGLAWNPVQH